jgi:hypothetical protein
VLRHKEYGGKGPSCHVLTRARVPLVTCLCWCWPSKPGLGVCQVSSGNGTFPLFPCHPPWKDVPVRHPWVRKGQVSAVVSTWGFWVDGRMSVLLSLFLACVPTPSCCPLLFRPIYQKMQRYKKQAAGSTRKKIQGAQVNLKFRQTTK